MGQKTLTNSEKNDILFLYILGKATLGRNMLCAKKFV